MNRKLKLMSVAFAVVIMAALSLGITVSAATPDEPTEIPYCEFGVGYTGYGAMAMPDVSEMLGLTVEEIHTLRSEGQSLAQIAATQGVSQEALVAAMLADRAETLAQRVADGDITQAQADLMLAQMTASVTESTQRTEIGPRADRGNSAARGSVAQRGGFGQRVCGDDAEVAQKMGGWQRGNAAADGTVVPSAMSRTW